MKKVLAVLLAVAMVMALAACGAKTEEETTVAPETEATEAVVESTEAPVADTTAAPEAASEAASEAAGDAATTAPGESTTAAKAPETKAEILAYYNTAVNKAYDAKVGFNKERTTDNEQMEGSAIVKTVKSIIYQFMGVGAENKYTETVTKGKWETETKKHYLRKSTLAEADLTNATITSDGKNYTIVLNVKNGSSKGGAAGTANNSPIDKCGICVGSEDKGYYDHKTGPVIYDAIEDVYSGASISESTSNCKITAVVDAATGNLVKLTVEFDIACNIELGIAGHGNATGTSHIIYKNFQY